jgi:hypothetical protein
VLGTGFDANVRSDWLRTGYQHFPYAAEQSGQWWVLRLNHGFPEHDLYTLFVDGRTSTPTPPPPWCRPCPATSTTAASTMTHACSAPRTTTR